MILEKIPEMRRLSAEEKLMLLTELWDELTANPDEVTLTPEQETGENDSDEILTHGFQFSKGCPLLSVAADLRRFGGSGSGIREKFTV